MAERTNEVFQATLEPIIGGSHRLPMPADQMPQQQGAYNKRTLRHYTAYNQLPAAAVTSPVDQQAWNDEARRNVRAQSTVISYYDHLPSAAAVTSPADQQAWNDEASRAIRAQSSESAMLTYHDSSSSSGGSHSSLPSHDSGHTSGRDSGHTSGHASGRDSGQTSGHASRRDSGQTSGHASRRDSGQTSGRDSGRGSGRDTGHGSGRDTGHVSGRGSGHGSGRDSISDVCQLRYEFDQVKFNVSKKLNAQASLLARLVLVLVYVLIAGMAVYAIYAQELMVHKGTFGILIGTISVVYISRSCK